MPPEGGVKGLAELAIVLVALIFAHFMPARLGYWDGGTAEHPQSFGFSLAFWAAFGTMARLCSS